MPKGKLLYISYYFAPHNTIGAVRPSKQVKYLARRGWDVTVLTSALKKADFADDEPHGEFDNLRVLRVPKGWMSKAAHALFNIALKLYAKLKKTAGEKAAPAGGGKTPSRASNKRLPSTTEIMTFIDSASWYARAKKALKTYLAGEKFDYVISTYGPISSHWLGMYAKRAGFARKWLADYRDLMVNFRLSRINNRLMALWQQRFCLMCDGITTVSEGTAETLASFMRSNGITDKAPFVLPNGFDAEDFAGIAGNPDKTALCLTYTGQLYSSGSDLTPLFRALFELASDGAIDIEKVRFIYAGPSADELKKQAQRYGLCGVVKDLGRLKRRDALKLQADSHVLVLASWSTKREKGIITGKLYEYMASGRPVVALISGELGDSELKRIIDLTGIGIAFEQAHENADFDRLKAFLKLQYDSVMSKGAPVYVPNEDAILEYEYSALSDKLERILLSI